MKVLLYSILILLNFSVYAQDPLLFQHNWRLESITIDTEVYTPSSTPNPIDFGTDFDYLYFNDYNSYYVMSFGIFNNVWGDDLIYDNTNSSFNITYTSLTLGESSPASTYFLHNFLNTGFNGDIQNPFYYSFTYANDLVYLHITNLAGSVALFYASNLSQEEFLKESISILPNPVKDVIYIESSGITLDHVNIYDMSGRLVEEYEKFNTQIDVGHLQKGVYILRIKTATGVLHQKLIKS